jgi:hypothetical protein
MHPQFVSNVAEVDTSLRQCLNQHEVLLAQHLHLHVVVSPHRGYKSLGAWGTSYSGALRTYITGADKHYPASGPWRVTVHRLIGEGPEVVSEVTVTDGTQSGRAITFSTVQEGRIARHEYWPDPFTAAAWRAQWVERM